MTFNCRRVQMRFVLFACGVLLALLPPLQSTGVSAKGAGAERVVTRCRLPLRETLKPACGSSSSRNTLSGLLLPSRRRDGVWGSLLETRALHAFVSCTPFNLQLTLERREDRKLAWPGRSSFCQTRRSETLGFSAQIEAESSPDEEPEASEEGPFEHLPVMENEAMHYLLKGDRKECSASAAAESSRAPRVFVDCTVGGGGFALAVSRRLLPQVRFPTRSLALARLNKIIAALRKRRVRRVLGLLGECRILWYLLMWTAKHWQPPLHDSKTTGRRSARDRKCTSYKGTFAF